MYRIKTVAELTGIPRNTILAWERRYGVIEPDRSDNGYRVYDDNDVAKLVRLKALVDQGLRISEAVELLQRDTTPTSKGPSAPPVVRDSLQSALLAYDRAAAEQIVASTISMSFERRLDEVYLPMLRAIGDGWAAGVVSVAQEHYASAFVREQLIGMLVNLGYGPEGGDTIVCACFPGEQHELGLLAAAVKLALRGFRIVYLGANLPVDELVSITKSRQPSMVCCSVMRMGDAKEVLATALMLRSQLPMTTQLCVGGAATAPIADRGKPGLVFCPRFQDLEHNLGLATVHSLSETG